MANGSGNRNGGRRPPPRGGNGGGSILTARYGPLPAWGWVAVVVVGYLLYKRFAGAKATAATPTGASAGQAPPTATATLPGGYSFSGPANVVAGLTQGAMSPGNPAGGAVSPGNTGVAAFAPPPGSVRSASGQLYEPVTSQQAGVALTGPLAQQLSIQAAPGNFETLPASGQSWQQLNTGGQGGGQDQFYLPIAG